MLYIKENQRRQRSVFGHTAQHNGTGGMGGMWGLLNAWVLKKHTCWACRHCATNFDVDSRASWCFMTFMTGHVSWLVGCFWRSSATSGTRSSKILKPRLGVDVECAGNVLWANPSFYTCFWDILRQISCSLSWQHDTSRSTRSPHSFLWGCCEGLLGRNVKQKCHGSHMEAEWLTIERVSRFDLCLHVGLWFRWQFQTLNACERLSTSLYGIRVLRVTPLQVCQWRCI